MSKWDKLIHVYVIYQKIFDLMNCEKYWKVMDMK